MVRLFHLTSASAVTNILKEGIKPSETKCLLSLREVQPIERDRAVFAYDEQTLRRIAKYGRPDDKVIEFEVDPKQVFIGELRAECSQKYKETVRPLSEYLQNPEKYSYIEPEIFVPKKIPPEEIIRVLERREFI